jgi:hypothetical protein
MNSPRRFGTWVIKALNLKAPDLIGTKQVGTPKGKISSPLEASYWHLPATPSHNTCTSLKALLLTVGDTPENIFRIVILEICADHGRRGNVKTPK